MLRKDQKVRITSDNENYADYMNKELKITGIYREDHPGYDRGLYPQKLVEFEGVPFALYEYEFEVIKKK